MEMEVGAYINIVRKYLCFIIEVMQKKYMFWVEIEKSFVIHNNIIDILYGIRCEYNMMIYYSK